MKLNFSVQHSLAAKKPSIPAGKVMGAFGLGSEVLEGVRTYVEPFTVDVADDAGQVLLFYGASGGGKTSCLRQYAQQTGAQWLHEVAYDPQKMVIEQLGDDFDYGVEIAGMVGLAEAFLLLRYPDELSDGQRYRFLMAKAIADGHKVLACDEFMATLDRVSAKVIAFNVRKIVSRFGMTFACATTHEDLLDDLQPDWLIYFDGHGAVVSHQTPQKKRSVSTGICSLREALARTGIGSSSGTIGATVAD